MQTSVHAYENFQLLAQQNTIVYHDKNISGDPCRSSFFPQQQRKEKKSLISYAPAVGRAAACKLSSRPSSHRIAFNTNSIYIKGKGKQEGPGRPVLRLAK